MNTRIISLSLLLGSLLSCPSLSAQAPANAPTAAPSEAEMEKRRKDLLDKIESFGWTREGLGKLGNRAQVAIPKGYRFTDGNGTREMMKIFENIPTERELGMLMTEGLGPWIIFEFDDVGYVKDDEKDKLDADALLKTLQEGQNAANARRRELGMDELHLVGWAVPPRFNDQTKNLEWATRIRAMPDGGESINYNTRLLGRRGVMEVTLVCEPEEMDSLMKQYQDTIATFAYLDGETYAEYRAGDKMAKYGLTALVAGGAAVAAGKMGLFAKLGALLAKLGKGLIVIVIAIGVAIKTLFSKIFGRSSKPETPAPM